MAEIVLESLTKRYTDGSLAVDALNLQIRDGEFVVLVGPSGCGKSTTLNMLAGLESISSGRILIDGLDVTHRSSQERDIAMVFQSYALYPHMSVRDNIAFPLKVAKLSKAEQAEKVARAAEILDLTQQLDRKPQQLSGGQRQRVAMGRAIVRSPKAFLMDEPLSNLDAKLRVKMRTQIASLQKQLGTTTVYVTHDQTEAMTLGQRVVLMRRGVVQQVDAPRVLYAEPANLFVAGFMGSPAMNFVSGRIEEGVLRSCLGEQVLDAAVMHKLAGSSSKRDIILGIRPEALQLAEAEGDGPTFSQRVENVELVGADIYAHVSLENALKTGELHPDVEPTHVLVVRLAADAAVQAGALLRLRVDAKKLVLFDAQTGRNVLSA